MRSLREILSPKERVSTTTKCAGRTHTTIARRATQERKEKERGDIFLID
jgi:hypothetical protein